MHSTRKARQHGFTLIELLVVIAIIAILAAILFPVFARARAKAKQTSCLSNVKEIDLATIMYAQDYDNRIPPIAMPSPAKPYFARKQYGNDGPLYWITWAEVVYPYTKNREIFYCPQHPKAGLKAGDGSGRRWVSYINNAAFGDAGERDYYGIRADWYGLPIDILDYPTSTIFWVDGPTYTFCAGADTFTNKGRAAGRHMEGANCAFADGHAKWYKKSVLDHDATPWLPWQN